MAAGYATDGYNLPTCHGRSTRYPHIPADYSRLLLIVVGGHLAHCCCPLNAPANIHQHFHPAGRSSPYLGRFLSTAASRFTICANRLTDASRFCSDSNTRAD
jgi:hypothetical protein